MQLLAGTTLTRQSNALPAELAPSVAILELYESFLRASFRPQPTPFSTVRRAMLFSLGCPSPTERDRADSANAHRPLAFQLAHHAVLMTFVCSSSGAEPSRENRQSLPLANRQDGAKSDSSQCFFLLEDEGRQQLGFCRSTLVVGLGVVAKEARVAARHSSARAARRRVLGSACCGPFGVSLRASV